VFEKSPHPTLKEMKFFTTSMIATISFLFSCSSQRSSLRVGSCVTAFQNHVSFSSSSIYPKHYQFHFKQQFKHQTSWFMTSSNSSSGSHSSTVSTSNIIKRVKTIDAVPSPETIAIKGWVRTVRKQKTLAFVEVNDGSTLSGIQCVLPFDDLDENSKAGTYIDIAYHFKKRKKEKDCDLDNKRSHTYS
jgi:hypothetical protein